jgi:beta-lactamase superfamily II metal-dependent hydrolase
LLSPQPSVARSLKRLETIVAGIDFRLLDASRGCENGNNDSLIVRVKYKEASYLFDRDAETESDPVCEAEVPMLVDFYEGTGLVNVDVYKVGHHGSANGTDEEFMQAMSPQISVISAGIHTQHGPGKSLRFSSAIQERTLLHCWKDLPVRIAIR